MIEWVECPESSTVVRFGHDVDSSILTVEFKQSTYNYHDVPQHVFDQMKAASSKGQFLSQVIKTQFRYSRA